MTDKTSAPREVTFLPPLRMPLTFAARTVDLRQPEQRAEEHKTRIDELDFRQFCLNAIFGGFWKRKTPYMVVAFQKISHKP
jgi:hypothetical protein